MLIWFYCYWLSRHSAFATNTIVFDKILKDDVNDGEESVIRFEGVQISPGWLQLSDLQKSTLETLSSLMLLCQTDSLLITLSSFQALTFSHVKQMRASILLCLLGSLCRLSRSLCVCSGFFLSVWQTQLRQGPLNFWWGNNWQNPASQHEKGSVFCLKGIYMYAAKTELFLLALCSWSVHVVWLRKIPVSVSASKCARRWSESGCIRVWVGRMTSLCKWRKGI